LAYLVRQGLISTEVVMAHKRAIGTKITVKYLASFYLPGKNDTPNDTPNSHERRGFPGNSDTPTDTVRKRDREKELTTFGAPSVPPKPGNDHMSPIPINRTKNRNWAAERGMSLRSAQALISRTYDKGYRDSKAVESFAISILEQYQGDTIKAAFQHIVDRNGGEGGLLWNQRNGFANLCRDLQNPQTNEPVNELRSIEATSAEPFRKPYT
jgi:hypothetical protein